MLFWEKVVVFEDVKLEDRKFSFEGARSEKAGSRPAGYGAGAASG